MRREELFQPGGYMALPFEVAKRTDLTWTAKGVWACLAQHLGPSNTTAWPSLTQIAAEIGCGRRTVQTAVEQLEAAHLAESVPPRPGETMTLPSGRVVPATTRYRLFQPEATLFDPTVPNDDDEGAADAAETPVGCGRNGASADSALAQKLPVPVAETAHEVLKGSTESKTPPQPPEGGVGVPECSEPPTTSERPRAGSASADRPADGGNGEGKATTAAVLAAVGSAYRKAFGADMPNRWERRLRREARGGAAAWLAAATADDVRAAVALAESRRRTFGVGWLIKHLEAKAIAAREAEARRGVATQTEAAARGAREESERLAAEADARRRHFAGLPAEVQASYRHSAAAVYPALRGAALDGQAVRMAWEERGAVAAVAEKTTRGANAECSEVGDGAVR